MSHKIGRPKENDPNKINLTIRINTTLNDKLNAYCKKNLVSKGQVVREGIEILLDEKK